jgi:RimJ/RimL family protein N-acetyltransferase
VPTFPILTERLVLRLFTLDDLDALHAYQSLPDAVRYVPWEARTREESRVALDRKMATVWPSEDGEVLTVAVERQDTGEMIGDVILALKSNEHRQGEIGFIFHPDHGGRGYATEAADVVLRLGFDELGLHRIVGHCDARNGASAALMERLGMRREAHFRHNEVFKGEWGEEFVYAILDDEWRGLHEAEAASGSQQR